VTAYIRSLSPEQLLRQEQQRQLQRQQRQEELESLKAMRAARAAALGSAAAGLAPVAAAPGMGGVYVYYPSMDWTQATGQAVSAAFPGWPAQAAVASYSPIVDLQRAAHTPMPPGTFSQQHQQQQQQQEQVAGMSDLGGLLQPYYDGSQCETSVATTASVSDAEQAIPGYLAPPFAALPNTFTPGEGPGACAGRDDVSGTWARVHRAVHEAVSSLEYFSIIVMEIPSLSVPRDAEHEPEGRILGLFLVRGQSVVEHLVEPARSTILLLSLLLSPELGDDAQMIEGIEARLLELGINSSRQVASLGGTDFHLLSRVAPSFGVPFAPAFPSVAEAVSDDVLAKLETLSQVCFLYSLAQRATDPYDQSTDGFQDTSSERAADDPVPEKADTVQDPQKSPSAILWCEISEAMALARGYAPKGGMESPPDRLAPTFLSQFTSRMPRSHSSAKKALLQGNLSFGLTRMLLLHAAMEEKCQTPTLVERQPLNLSKLWSVLHSQPWRAQLEFCVFIVLTRNLLPLACQASSPMVEPKTMLLERKSSPDDDSFSSMVMNLVAYRAMLTEPQAAETLYGKATALAKDLFPCSRDSTTSWMTDNHSKTVQKCIDGILMLLDKLTGYSPAVLLCDPRMNPSLVIPESTPQTSAIDIQRIFGCTRVEAHLHGSALMEELRQYCSEWPTLPSDMNKSTRLRVWMKRRAAFPRLCEAAHRNAQVAISYPSVAAYIRTLCDELKIARAESSSSSVMSYLSDLFIYANGWLVEPTVLQRTG
jgi:hypothetical protein